MIWAHLDSGTFDAILRLYRSAPSEQLARLGERLGSIEAPALVAWSTKDRYLPLRFGRAYADALPGASCWSWRGWAIGRGSRTPRWWTGGVGFLKG